MSKIGQAVMEMPPCECYCHDREPFSDFCDDCMENHNLRFPSID